MMDSLRTSLIGSNGLADAEQAAEAEVPFSELPPNARKLIGAVMNKPENDTKSTLPASAAAAAHDYERLVQGVRVAGATAAAVFVMTLRLAASGGMNEDPKKSIYKYETGLLGAPIIYFFLVHGIPTLVLLPGLVVDAVTNLIFIFIFGAAAMGIVLNTDQKVVVPERLGMVYTLNGLLYVSLLTASIFAYQAKEAADRILIIAGYIEEYGRNLINEEEAPEDINKGWRFCITAPCLRIQKSAASGLWLFYCAAGIFMICLLLVTGSPVNSEANQVDQSQGSW